MKMRFWATAVAALAAAGTGLAQAPSLPPIEPIPQAPATVPSTDPAPTTLRPQDRPVVPNIPAAPVPHQPGELPGPPTMPAPETPCTSCNNRFIDEHVGPGHSFWVRPEVAYLWLAPARVPALGVDTTTGTVVLGGADQSYSGAFAGLLHFGGWLNERHTTGVYAGGMMSDKRTVVATVSGGPAGGTPAIARPFVNALNGAADSLLVAGVNGTQVANGSLASNVSARIAGADAGIVWNVLFCPNYFLNFTFGYRYVDLDEQLSIFQATDYVTGLGLTSPTYSGAHPAASVGPLTSLQITDRFRTRNQFHGMEFGLDGEWCFGPLFVGLTPKVAFGTNRQTTDVDGSTTFVGGTGGVVTVPGGLYAVGDLFGHDSVNRFAVLADVTGKVGVNLTAGCRLTVGYNFIYLNNVARPGLEIQPVISPRAIPASQAFGSTSGVLAPQRAFDRTDYVAHGVQLGLEVRY